MLQLTPTRIMREVLGFDIFISSYNSTVEATLGSSELSHKKKGLITNKFV